MKKTVTRNKMRGATSARKTKSHAAAPKLSAQAALSFLKETKGALTWTAQEFARGVGITVAEAGPALAVLQMQGYIKPVEGKNEWMTSVDGDAVSGAAAPRFSSEAVKKALVDLRGRIAAVNKDAKADFRVASAIAFGDFLLDRAQAQAADVGIELARRNARDAKRISKAEERAFLKTLRAGKQIIRLIPLEPWMRERAHLRIH